MFVGCFGLLIAAAGFMTEVPPLIRGRIASTNETAGVFRTVKKFPNGRELSTSGTYRIRPGVDFEWRTTEPFDTLFLATTESYVYSNEDEVVTRKLSELPGGDRFARIGKAEPEMFFEVFDALYKEEGGKFFMKAKPKPQELKQVLERVEAEGTAAEWQLRAVFPNGIEFSLFLRDR